MSITRNAWATSTGDFWKLHDTFARTWTDPKKGFLSVVRSWHEHVQAIITAAFVVLGSDITSDKNSEHGEVCLGALFHFKAWQPQLLRKSVYNFWSQVYKLLMFPNQLDVSGLMQTKICRSHNGGWLSICRLCVSFLRGRHPFLGAVQCSVQLLPERNFSWEVPRFLHLCFYLLSTELCFFVALLQVSEVISMLSRPSQHAQQHFPRSIASFKNFQLRNVHNCLPDCICLLSLA